ncbi:MAG: VOC family protein [Pseudomonadales bacterium]
MTDILQQQLNLPPIDQIGFVVPDLDAALQLYDPLFGPFEMMDAPLQGTTFRGKKIDCHLSLAFGKSGALEMEFITVLSGACPHQEFLDAGGNGMHHVRYRVSDHDEKVAAARAIGFNPIWSMRMDGDIAFSYLQREGDPLIIEILQMP